MDKNEGDIRTILVIDDEPAILKVIINFLLADGHNVLAAADGDQALAICRDNAIDVAIIDMVMPGKNGTETTKDILNLYPDTPVIKMSGFMDLSDSLTLSASKQFLKKPFLVDELREKVNIALRVVDTFIVSD